ncbi:hypothetical protein LXL04_030793 [Taraxacum kok-saghyz]
MVEGGSARKRYNDSGGFHLWIQDYQIYVKREKFKLTSNEEEKEGEYGRSNSIDFRSDSIAFSFVKAASNKGLG